jgi:cellulose biosynthesis protein BcsQ
MRYGNAIIQVNNMKVIAPTNNKGGVGKTKVSEILAEYFSKVEGKRTLGIDLDSQCNFSQHYVDMTSTLTTLKENVLLYIQIMTHQILTTLIGMEKAVLQIFTLESRLYPILLKFLI